MDTDLIGVKRILWVEDDLQDVEMILAAVEDLGLGNTVAVVNDGAEALDYLYRRGKFKTRPGGDPILVVLDNNMPKVNGLEVLKVIKADAELRMIPVVAFTSSREMLDLNEFYRHGVNAYVVKPVAYSEFIKIVKQIGGFWVTANEPPPPYTESGKIFIEDLKALSPDEKEFNLI
jgi:CheY-like chemotaxis protein